MDHARRPARRLDDRPLVRALYAMNRLYARVWHRVEVLNACPIPRYGAGILVCNHGSGLDPFLLQSGIPRVVTWMMAREYFDLPGVRQTCGYMQYIPVRREERDATSLKAALRALAEGKLLGVFPEGRIETSKALLPFLPGAAQIAVKTRTPIFPAYLGGLRRNLGIARDLMTPQSARLIFGPPIDATSCHDVPHAMRHSLERLKNQCFA